MHSHSEPTRNRSYGLKTNPLGANPGRDRVLTGLTGITGLETRRPRAAKRAAGGSDTLLLYSFSKPVKLVKVVKALLLEGFAAYGLPYGFTGCHCTRRADRRLGVAMARLERSWAELERLSAYQPQHIEKGRPAARQTSSFNAEVRQCL